MKYAFTLTPTKVVGRDTKLTIKMRPTKPDVAPKIAEAPPAVIPPPTPCTPQCDIVSGFGWTSSGGVATEVSGVALIDTMVEGPWSVRLDLINSQTCNEHVITWAITGDYTEGADYVAAPTDSSIWLFGQRIDGYPSGTMTVQALIDGEPFCDPFVFTFTGVTPSTDYWDHAPSFDTFTAADIAGAGNHFDFTDARGPLHGVGMSTTFSLITQASGSPWITPPYLVDNLDNTYSLWFDTMDAGDLAGGFVLLLSFYTTGGIAYGDPITLTCTP